jgi:hypothetical protein
LKATCETKSRSCDLHCQCHSLRSFTSHRKPSISYERLQQVVHLLPLYNSTRINNINTFTSNSKSRNRPRKSSASKQSCVTVSMMKMVRMLSHQLFARNDNQCKTNRTSMHPKKTVSKMMRMLNSYSQCGMLLTAFTAALTAIGKSSKGCAMAKTAPLNLNGIRCGVFRFFPPPSLNRCLSHKGI